MISIGELARRAQCTVPTIRFYEQSGLMPAPQRRQSGHRVYDRKDLARLNLIRRCRDCDMPLERIAELITLSEGAKPCAETVAFFRTQRETIQARIKALQDLDFSLGLYVQGCESECLPKDGPCGIYDDLQAG